MWLIWASTIHSQSGFDFANSPQPKLSNTMNPLTSLGLMTCVLAIFDASAPDLPKAWESKCCPQGHFHIGRPRDLECYKRPTILTLWMKSLSTISKEHSDTSGLCCRQCKINSFVRQIVYICLFSFLFFPPLSPHWDFIKAMLNQGC